MAAATSISCFMNPDSLQQQASTQQQMAAALSISHAMTHDSLLMHTCAHLQSLHGHAQIFMSCTGLVRLPSHRWKK
eukprot:scaffold112053_cov19-Tisochrysis_lutea.AAC.1